MSDSKGPQEKPDETPRPTKPRTLVLAAAGNTGLPAALDLLDHDFPVTALVRRDDGRAARLRETGADVVGSKTGRWIRLIPLPAWFARLNQALVAPFSKPAASVFALMGFVASYQPRWDSAPVVRRFSLPKQMTVSDYLDANYVRNRPKGNLL